MKEKQGLHPDKFLTKSEEDSTNNDNRISELLTELGECREDERNSQNQIVQVISTAGAILGILFSASYFSVDDLNRSFGGLEYVTNVRVLFGLSSCVFCTAFSYIVVLGLGNVLRYYYIKDLEMRLYRLVPCAADDRDSNRAFFHWNSFYAPIITRNIKHVNSIQTLLNFICYSLAIVCAILFSITLTFAQYLMIKGRRWHDHLGLAVPLVLMGLSAVSFVYISLKAEDTSKFCWKTAQENRESKKSQQNVYAIRHLILYLFYPKIKDLQKPGLIVLSYFVVLFLGKACMGITWEWRSQVHNLVIFLFIFDFLAYQARYQINDIRGMKEDKEALAVNRLVANETGNESVLIKLSFSVALIKIVTAVVVTCTLDRMYRIPLLCCLFCLLLFTVLYETARAKSSAKWVYLFVGTGYPLRVMVGVLAAYPEIWKNVICTNNVNMPLYAGIVLLMAFWAYGTCAGILPWVDEVSSRMQKGWESTENQFPQFYEKKHFMEIQKKIQNRYINAKENKVGERVLPMREKGEISDVWNVSYLIAMSLLAIFIFMIVPLTGKLFIFEGAFLAISFLICARADRKQIVALTLAEGLIIIIKGYVARGHLREFYIYLFISCIQVLFAATYFLLRYQPQMKKISLVKLFIHFIGTIIRLIIGEYAWNTIKNDRLARNKQNMH